MYPSTTVYKGQSAVRLQGEIRGMLHPSVATKVFEECRDDLKRAMLMVTPSDSAAAASTNCGIDEPQVLEDGLLDYVERYALGVTFTDTLTQMATILRNKSEERVSPCDRGERQAKKWILYMKQFLKAVRGALHPHHVTDLPPEVGAKALAVSRLALTICTRHVSVQLPVVAQRSIAPLHDWIRELHALMSESRGDGGSGMILTNGSVAHTLLSDIITMFQIAPSLNVTENSTSGPCISVDDDNPAVCNGVKDRNEVALVLGGYPSLVPLVVLHAQTDFRDDMLLRVPVTTPFTSKLAELFLSAEEVAEHSTSCVKDEEVGAVHCVDRYDHQVTTVAHAAMSNFLFVLQAVRHGAQVSQVAEEREQLVRYERKGLWEPFISSIATNVVRHPSKGMARFVYDLVYHPFTVFNAFVPCDGALPPREWADDTTQTALYRLLQIVSDLAQQELLRAAPTTKTADGAATVTNDDAQRIVTQQKYRELIKRSNGAIDASLLREVLADNNVLLEDTQSRSAHGHALYRAFQVVSGQRKPTCDVAATNNDDDDGPQGFFGIQCGEDEEQAILAAGSTTGGSEIWLYIDRGVVYVRRPNERTGGAPQYDVMTSIDVLLAPFRAK